MKGKEKHRLAKNGTLRSIRGNGQIYEKSKVDQQWRLWTTLDATGRRRMDAIVATLQADGWSVLR